MFDLSDSAKSQLDKYFENQDKSPIRVYLAAGWGGPRLALALDEQKDNDSSFDVKGFQFLVDRNLMDTVAPIQVDMTEAGFVINSRLKVDPSGCSSCTSCWFLFRFIIIWQTFISRQARSSLSARWTQTAMSRDMAVFHDF